jgi:glutamate synthase (NADPH/NADH) small chain
MRERPPLERAKTFEEVNCGYDLDMAKLEAERCLFCKKPLLRADEPNY